MRKRYYLTDKEMQQIYDDKQKYRVKCKCGHTNTILSPKGYQICNWCKNYVFLNPQVEFEYRMKEKINKEKRENR